MALYDHLGRLGVDDDFLREGVALLVQLLMEMEVEEQVVPPRARFDVGASGQLRVRFDLLEGTPAASRQDELR